MNLIGQRLGQYEVLARFGEGGMATVFRAKQDKVGREVAIKVMSPALAKREVFARRFEREAKMIAQLSHPHIVKLFDYGTLRGFHMRLIDPSFDPKTDIFYFVMELMLGGSLASRLRKARCTPQETNHVLHQIAPALDYAHEQGIIHRDLKPANVLFDDHQNAFITDFGIAKLMEEDSDQNSLTQEGTTLGTPSYMSPELWQGENIGSWTDIYALGIMVFEMLTGKLPFVAGTPFRVMHMHLFDPPPTLQRYDAALPTSLEPVLQRVLAKDPKDRYPTAVAFAEAFDAALQAAPLQVTASPAPDPHGNPTAAQKEKASQSAASADATRWLLIGLVVALALSLVVVMALLSSRS